ncbi:MAG: hypothetical protein LUG50_07225, partial [Planctomycetaceae bacterium]|nr:hypothetical protein [Planctomycetaceae bacterium]
TARQRHLSSPWFQRRASYLLGINCPGGFFSSTPFRQGFHERARPASEAARGLPSKKKNVPHGRTFSARKIDFTFS